MASRGTVGCYLRELNIDELAWPIPEYVTHVLYGLEPHDPKNLLCRKEAQISAPLPRSFPSQLRSFFFHNLTEMVKYTTQHNYHICPEYTILRNFPKKFSGWRHDSVTPSFLREGTKMEQKRLL